MEKLGTVESTLFVPLLGRIYASEHFPGILLDEKAKALKHKIPKDMAGRGKQNQYTFLASASRSANMDRFIKDFLQRKPEGVIVQLGCGLETAFFRNDNGKTMWYGVDLPDVIAYRETLLPASDRERYIAGDAFSDTWITLIRKEAGNVPLLVTASGLFYYFQEEKVIGLLQMLSSYGPVEIVFDAVNKQGMGMMRRKWMKQVGHGEAKMFFYVDRAADLIQKMGREARLLAEEPYYSHIDKTGLHFLTKISMAVSDRMNMVKMVHLGLGEG